MPKKTVYFSFYFNLKIVRFFCRTLYIECSHSEKYSTHTCPCPQNHIVPHMSVAPEQYGNATSVSMSWLTIVIGRLRLKCDGTRAETRFKFLAKRTSPFKSAGVPVQSTTGSGGVRISGSNAGYTMFRGSVKSTGYPTPFASFPFTSSPVRHRVPSHFNWTLHECGEVYTGVQGRVSQEQLILNVPGDCKYWFGHSVFKNGPEEIVILLQSSLCLCGFLFLGVENMRDRSKNTRK